MKQKPQRDMTALVNYKINNLYMSNTSSSKQNLHLGNHHTFRSYLCNNEISCIF